MPKFARKQNDLDGVAVITVNKKDIKIVGRGIYETEDAAEVAALRTDSVFVEIKGKKK